LNLFKALGGSIGAIVPSPHKLSEESLPNRYSAL